MFSFWRSFGQSLVLFDFQKKSSVWDFLCIRLELTVFRDVTLFSSKHIGKCFSRVSNSCFCQWGDPRIDAWDLFRCSAWDDPLFRSLVNVTLSSTPSRTMPPRAPGCGRATHSSLVPRTLPRPSPWLSLRGDRVVLISIAWYVRVKGEYGGQKVQGGGELS